MKLASRHCSLRTYHAPLLRYRPSILRARWPIANSSATTAPLAHFNSISAKHPFCPKLFHSRTPGESKVNGHAHEIAGPIYVPEVDLEDFEEYTTGGFHPVAIGDEFMDGRYVVVHKLGFGGYSTIWLARDTRLHRYVSLRILVANETSKSIEAEMLRRLHCAPSEHPGQQFVARLLDEFLIKGPNGTHICLVQEPARSSVTASKEDSTNLMFPVETARSIAAQLIMGLSYLHSQGVCHGDLHLRNFLLYDENLDEMSPEELQNRYRLDTVPITRVDGKPVRRHAPSVTVYPLRMKMAANTVADPIVKISDFGTSFCPATTSSPELHTPPLFLPPEDFFRDQITLAADVWTLGISIYDVLGERCLFESFTSDPDDILADIISTLGPPPKRWWNRWENRPGCFAQEGSWAGEIERTYMPGSRPLQKRMWDMGRGETAETCEWEVNGGEMGALEELLRSILAWEPADRLTAEEVMGSEYMAKWAMPAWERQLRRRDIGHNPRQKSTR